VLPLFFLYGSQLTLLQARFIDAVAGSAAGRMNCFLYITFCLDTKSNQKSQDWIFLLKNPEFLFRKFTNLRENVFRWMIDDSCRASNNVNFSMVVTYMGVNEEIQGFS
jgi:hypothetical protein